MKLNKSNEDKIYMATGWKSSSVINNFWKDKTSLIMAARSNAQWFRVTKIRTVESKTFSIFLCLLEKIVIESNCTNSLKSVIILENTKVHISNYTKTVKSSLKLEVRFLPPYCPEVVPIEHTLMAIKAKLRSRTPFRTIDFIKQTGIEALKDAVLSISQKTFESAWTEVIKECTEGIKSTVTELNDN